MSVTPDSTLADPQQIIADLQCQLGECRAELDKAQRNLNETTTERDEALAREGATAEVLRVINSSPGELAPVFKAVLQSAVRICEANFGTLYLHETGAFRAVAMHNARPVYSEKRGNDGSWQIRQSDGDGSQGAGRWLKRHYRAPNMRWKTSV